MIPSGLQKTSPVSGTARPAEVALWLLMALAWTAACCWASVLVAERFAPVIVLPLAVGLSLGAGCALAMRLAGLGSRRWLLAGTLACSLALEGSQHYLWYRITQDRIEQEYAHKLSGNKLSSLAMSIPQLYPSFAEFLQATAQRGRAWFGLTLHGGWVWASWALDAALESAAAIGFVWLATRQPYCPRCRSWYRTVRRGTLNAGQAAAILRLCHGPALPQASHYAVWHCQSGCGAALLELLGSGRGQRVAIWLDDAARRGVLELLDGNSIGVANSTSTKPNGPMASSSDGHSATEEQA